MINKLFYGCGLVIVMAIQVNASTLSKNTLEAQVDSVILTVYGDAINSTPGLGIMISRQGEMQFGKAYGMADMEKQSPLTTTTNLRMASVSKQFTAMAVFLLIEQGKLSFDTPLSTIFQDLPSWATQIAVGQLLNHTSGIWDYEGLIPGDRREQVSDADVLEMIRTVDRTYFAPGTQFRYSNTGFCLLSLIVERVSGTDYRDYMKRQLFQPLGMDRAYMYHAGTEMPDRAFGYRSQATGTAGEFRFADQSVTSATKGDGCVYVSPESYHRWANAVLKSAFPSDNYLALIQSRKTPVKDGIYYSLGWFVAPPGDGKGMRLFHSGETTGFRNIVYHDLGTGLSISIFANRDDTLISGVFEGIMGMMGESHPAAEAAEPKELFFWMSSIY